MTPVQIVAASENPLLPALYDIVWSAVCLLIVFLVVWKYVLPAFNKTLDERAQRIQGGIEKAEKVQAEADQALAEYQKQLADGRAEAARLRAEAQEEGAQIIAEMKAQAHTELIASSLRHRPRSTRNASPPWCSCAPKWARSPRTSRRASSANRSPMTSAPLASSTASSPISKRSRPASRSRGRDAPVEQSLPASRSRSGER